MAILAQSDMQDLADAMLPPPSEDPESPMLKEYLMKLWRVQSMLRFATIGIKGNDYELALYYRNSIASQIKKISDMSKRAREVGLFIQEDPFVFVRSLNEGRTVMHLIPHNPSKYAEVWAVIEALAAVVENEHVSGAPVLSRPQVGSMTISFEGLRGIPSSVFNADLLKKQQALNEINKLDFSKRKTRVLFVAERDEDTLDIIVGIKRMRDASGYTVKLFDKFNEKVHSKQILANDKNDIVASAFYSSMLSNIVEKTTSKEDVILIRFENVSRHSAFMTSVTPFQNVSNSQNNLFKQKLNRLTLTDKQLEAIKNEISEFAGKDNIDAVTPYPFISNAIYGTHDFGWMLSGLNLLSSFERGDVQEVVRAYSFIGAKYSTLSELVKAGKFFIPSDKSTFIESLGTSFISHGIAGTLSEVFDKCGMFMFFDEREGFDVDTTSLNREAATKETSILSTILSEVDQENATVLPSSIYRSVSNSKPKPPSATSLAVEQNTSLSNKLDNSDDFIDITTFNGMSRLMNIIVDASSGV